MLKVKHCGPKNGKRGYIKIYRDRELIVYIECNFFAPYQYAIKHKMGWLAKAIRKAMLEAGCNAKLCDYILKTGKYDHRNPKGVCSDPKRVLSRLNSRNAKLRHKAEKERKTK